MDFEERNIVKKYRYFQDLQEMGAAAVPTTVIGEHMIVGFHPYRLDWLLGL